MNPRSDATKIIYGVIRKQQSLDTVLPTCLEKYTQANDAALLQELCYGTLRWYDHLDAVLQLLLRSSKKKIDSIVHVILLLGIYQLLFLRIPEYAAIAESVATTRKLKKPWAAGVVNAILRNFQREKAALLAQIEHDQVAKYSHPNWFINLLKRYWPEKWEQILTANNAYPPMHLRVNLAKISRNDYLALLAKQEIAVTANPEVISGITLKQPCLATKLPGFHEGLVSVQDLAAQHAAYLLELQPGQRVLDACAAPGGKTAHILETEPNLAEMVAVDIAKERLTHITSNLERLHCAATLVCGDAANPQAWWNGKQFDRILLDAPCSGTGVIRRHPDIKVLRRATDIEANAKLQLQLLTALWPLLVPGGILLYATCSLLPSENNLVIEQFMSRCLDAKELLIAVSWGVAVSRGRQLFPESNANDGFYYCKLQKLA